MNETLLLVHKMQYKQHQTVIIIVHNTFTERFILLSIIFK